MKTLHLCFNGVEYTEEFLWIRCDPFWATEWLCAYTAYSDEHSQVLGAQRSSSWDFCPAVREMVGTSVLSVPAPVWPKLQYQPGLWTSLLSAKKGSRGCKPVFKTGFKIAHDENILQENIEISDVSWKNQRKCSLLAYLIFAGPLLQASSVGKNQDEIWAHLIAEGICCTTNSACSI